MDGVLVVNKPLGPTSFDVVARVRRAAKQKRVGHAGTLDPNASGVLIVCLGNATRIVEFLMDWRKGYRASAVFGIETDSEDATGSIVQSLDASKITREMVQAVLPHFTGRILQTPPMVSALHHNGRRLYDLAREGQVVEREARPVEVYSIELLDFKPGDSPQAAIDVECSKGTYIRTLCADIGRELGCGGHMLSLVRTHVGKFSLQDAVTLEDLEELGSQGRLEEIVYSIDDVLSEMPSVSVSDDADALKVMNGVSLPAGSITGLASTNSSVRIHGPRGEFLAIGRICGLPVEEAFLKPEKVFLPAK